MIDTLSNFHSSSLFGNNVGFFTTITFLLSPLRLFNTHSKLEYTCPQPVMLLSQCPWRHCLRYPCFTRTPYPDKMWLLACLCAQLRLCAVPSTSSRPLWSRSPVCPRDWWSHPPTQGFAGPWLIVQHLVVPIRSACPWWIHPTEAPYAAAATATVTGTAIEEPDTTKSILLIFWLFRCT